MQGNKEFIAEVSKLSLLNHENLVNLIGYCADGDQRLLVYEYIPGGPVENHLLGAQFRFPPALTDFHLPPVLMCVNISLQPRPSVSGKTGEKIFRLLFSKLQNIHCNAIYDMF